MNFNNKLYEWSKNRIELNEDNPEAVDEIKKIARRLKIEFNEIISHFNISKEEGKTNYRKLNVYLPTDIEELKNLLNKYEDLWSDSLNEEYKKILKRLSDYSFKLSNFTEYTTEELNEEEKEIIDSLKNTVRTINKVIRDFEFKR